MPNFSELPCGAHLPRSAHAVSVSLPKLRDLIGYENGEPETLKKVQRGYPRFHIHPYVAQVEEHVSRQFEVRGQPRVLASSERTALALCRFAGITKPRLIAYRDVVLVVLPEDEDTVKKAKAFLQHTGGGISSRRAEDLLLAEGLLNTVQQEEIFSGDARAHLVRSLGRAYGAEQEGCVHLGNFGMNAIYGVYNSLSSLQRERGRDEWVQFGWLFMDTIELVRKLRPPGVASHAIHSSLNIEELEVLLNQRGKRIAGIFTEAPSNPMLRTPDLEQLRQLADRHGCALVIDATLGTPHNVDVLPYADVAVESLTKYASGSADIMMGAAILNARSRFY
jgi:hypothetical protein